MRPRYYNLLVLVVLASGCASGGSGAQGSPRNRNKLVQEELAPLAQFTAWDAVQRLRPMWMRPGGIRNSANPAGHYAYVFVDGRPFGAMESLRGFRVENVEEMQFVEPSDATIRYGGEYQGGVILVTTKRRP